MCVVVDVKPVYELQIVNQKTHVAGRVSDAPMLVKDKWGLEKEKNLESGDTWEFDREPLLVHVDLDSVRRQTEAVSAAAVVDGAHFAFDVAGRSQPC